MENTKVKQKKYRASMFIGIITGSLGIPYMLIRWFIPAMLIFAFAENIERIGISVIALSGIAGSAAAIVFGVKSVKHPKLSGIMFLVLIICFIPSILLFAYESVIFIAALIAASVFSFLGGEQRLKVEIAGERS